MNELISKYNKVFDEEGNIKACGRENCKALIKAIHAVSDKIVGDEETGFMRVDILKKEYKKLVKGYLNVL